MARCIWQYKDGTFVDLPHDASGEIEKGYVAQQGKGKYDIEIEGRKYTVCFTGFLQKNISSGKERKVRRMMQANSWEFKDDDGWRSFDALSTKKLENAMRSSTDNITLSVSGGKQLNVNLKKLTQTSSDNHKKRKIRRVWSSPVSLLKSKQILNSKIVSLTGEVPEETESESDDQGCSAAVKRLKVDSEPTDVMPSGDLPTPYEAVQKIFSPEFTKSLSIVRIAGTIPPAQVVYTFDMDDTLITTRGKHVHPKNAQDWQWLTPEVPGMLKKLVKDGIKIVIFSNQAGIAGNKFKENQIKTKIANMSKELGFNIPAYIAAGKDMGRKPNVGMWFAMEHDNGGTKVDISKSMYIGDAAGRKIDTLGGKGKDFSCSDRKFARNVGVKFETPEEFFRGAKPASFSWCGFVPDLSTMNAKLIPKAQLSQTHQEVVLMIGYPGCGKSTFSHKNFIPNGYVHVNRDTLKTPAKCKKVLIESLTSGKSAVIDNTNPKSETRLEYIKIALSHKVPIRCFHFSASYEMAQHLNYYREFLTKGSHKHVPDIAYRMYGSGFTAPSKKEGFSEIIQVDFVPEFKNETEKGLFQMSLV